MDDRDERKRTSDDASKRFRRRQNWSCTTAPGRAWRIPTYWPRGARCIGGMTLVRALVRNFRTCPAMPREKVRFAACKLVLHPEKTKIVYCKDANRRGDFRTSRSTFLGLRSERGRRWEGDVGPLRASCPTPV